MVKFQDERLGKSNTKVKKKNESWPDKFIVHKRMGRRFGKCKVKKEKKSTLDKVIQISTAEILHISRNNVKIRNKRKLKGMDKDRVI